MSKNRQPISYTGIIRKKPFWSVFCLVCGLGLISLFLFIRIVDSTATNDTLALLFLGIAISIGSLTTLLFNYRAYFRLEDGHIHAKYHWLGKLDCALEDVAFVIAQTNTLSLLLKNGKRYVIMGIENAYILSSAIRRNNFILEADTPEALRQQLELLQAKRKRSVRWVLIGVLLMFVILIYTICFTGQRDLHQFSRLDWVLFSIMVTLEVLTVITLFWAASYAGRFLLTISHLQYRLQGTCIASQPLPPGKILHVYTDANHYSRMIVCGLPNTDEVYYCIQGFVSPSRLETIHTSEIYENMEDLLDKGLSSFMDGLPYEDVSSFIDISSHFL